MTLDINTLRSAATVLAFGAFLLVVWRTWRRQAQSEHAAAEALPFLQDEQGGPRE